ncbi:MAG: alpha-E domain-containing protein [Acidimicrobiia bacterium]|nr:alpha-E domain-containing protein [Acidimicrobiia bacterium]
MALLSRVADSLFWAGRQVERAEDSARIVAAYTDTIVDLPRSVTTSWAPLLAITGHLPPSPASNGGLVTDEVEVITHLLADLDNPGSVASSINGARENLRSARDVLPREAWRTLNDLWLFSAVGAADSVDRRSRPRFLSAVIDASRRLDGVIDTCMLRDDAYHLWRLGRLLERADMTTRILGVRAAALLREDREYAGVQWMSVLHSLSGLQMYQRASSRPVEGPAVVAFLLHEPRFPRSVRGCVAEMRDVLGELRRPGSVTMALDAVDLALPPKCVADGTALDLDRAMDRVQVALGSLCDSITARYLRPGDQIAVG